MRGWRIGAALLSLLAAGCAQNALLELTVVLPAPSAVGATDAAHALVRFRSGDAIADPTRGFALGEDLELQIPLSTGATTVTASVVLDDAARLTEPLWLQVQYCQEAGCTALADTGARARYVRIERAFYQGVYTSVRVELPSEPWPLVSEAPATLELDKCQVSGEGCFEGTFSGNCRMLGDAPTHVCE